MAGKRELLKGELPDATAVPTGCRFHPRCPKRFEPCDRIDPPLLDAGRAGQQAACLLHDPAQAGAAAPPPMAERWRDIGGPVGRMEPGSRNSITDVPGVRVGHAQAESGERSGVTVVAPPSLPALAGVQTVNGMGELTGWLEIEESGGLETPVYLCGTHALGTVYQAAIEASGHGPDDVTIAVVGECDDGDMADSRRVTAGDVERALGALGTDVAEGTVGAGTGMDCYGFPGGIGTASRLVAGYTVGVLLLCNFGDPDYLDLFERRAAGRRARRARQGSCIAVCITDAPLWPRQLRRLALRPLLGLARTGSYAHEGLGRDRDRALHIARRDARQRGAQPVLRRRLRGRPGGGLQLPGRRAPGRAPRRDDAGGVPDRGHAPPRRRPLCVLARDRPDPASPCWRPRWRCSWSTSTSSRSTWRCREWRTSSGSRPPTCSG